MVLTVRRSVFIGSLFVLAEAARAVAPVYRVQVLPVPENCEAYSVWHGLTQDGEASGILLCDSWTVTKAAVWRGHTLIELATLGGPSAVPYGTGKKGAIVGSAETPDMYDSEYHVQRPTLWTDGIARDLGTLG